MMILPLSENLEQLPTVMYMLSTTVHINILIKQVTMLIILFLCNYLFSL